MTDLNALIIFAKVVEAKSFSEAARRLGMPISTVSRRVAELEDQLGVRLLDRSTRNLRLTDLGTEVLEQATRSVEINDAVESIVSNQLANLPHPRSLAGSSRQPAHAQSAARVQGLRGADGAYTVSESSNLMMNSRPCRRLRRCQLRVKMRPTGLSGMSPLIPQLQT